ncbi:EamA family transporter [Chitinophaga sancti]|uniref:EamA family transporter n=1 Tax=Chitinophaga sancti TaxID=1004 RepID=A0A1K1S4G7_9BACT|nr:EamA family transporter [Chitinophaga sancti]WQD63720.1 EamA family transporter [Chitinophaga sancti]WQG90655.1 EamA family transporter [Chitinophaga sancti]SFW79214.1 transporter family protein [Chitinophaga sancti]
MWRYYALLSALFAGLTAVLAKFGLQGINSNLATAIRTVVILVIAWGIVFAGGEAKDLQALTKRHLLFLTLSGVATGLSWIFYFKALAIGPVSKVAPIDKLSVAIAIVLSAVLLKESLDYKTVVGAVLIMAGTFVLIR